MNEAELYRKASADIMRIMHEYIQTEKPSKIIELLIAKHGKDVVLKAVQDA